jgi:hypothetical protein
MILRNWYAPKPTGVWRQTLDGFHALLRWSPLPSLLTVLLTVVLPVAAGATALTAVIRDARADRDGTANGPDGNIDDGSDRSAHSSTMLTAAATS